MVHHGEALRRLIQDDQVVDQLKRLDYAKARIDQSDQVMLAYVLKLTAEPWAMVEPDVQALREAGFSDEEILIIANTASYFALINRVADGLGVELEAVWPPS